MTLQPFVGPWAFSSFLILYTLGRSPWAGDQSVARPLPTHRTTQTHNKLTQTSMLWVGFEPTMPAFERAKTVYALDSVATVIGTSYIKRQSCPCAWLILDLCTSWRWMVSFTPRPLSPRERVPLTHWIGGWVDPRADLEDVEKIKFLTLARLELRPLVRPARS
jgi:hypothetical protein